MSGDDGNYPPGLDQWNKWMTVMVVLAAFLLAYRLYITWRGF